MQKIFLIVAILATIFSHNTFSQDSTKPPQLQQLLSGYYDIKDALVSGNANTAASKAEAFVRNANAIDYKVISEGNINTLVKDAGKISETKDLGKQREYFADFSSNMVAVAKAFKLSDQPIYQAYCQMKKAYWLTNEKAVKNPYFGSSMLTCGQVIETLQ